MSELLLSSSTSSLRTRSLQPHASLRIRALGAIFVVTEGQAPKPWRATGEAVRPGWPQGSEKIDVARETVSRGRIHDIPLLVGTVPAKAQSLKMAQGVDVQVGCSGHIRDRTWPADHVRGTLLTFRASWQSDL